MTSAQRRREGGTKNEDFGWFSRLNLGDRGREGGPKIGNLEWRHLWMIPHWNAIFSHSQTTVVSSQKRHLPLGIFEVNVAPHLKAVEAGFLYLQYCRIAVKSAILLKCHILQFQDNWFIFSKCHLPLGIFEVNVVPHLKAVEVGFLCQQYSRIAVKSAIPTEMPYSLIPRHLVYLVNSVICL